MQGEQIVYVWDRVIDITTHNYVLELPLCIYVCGIIIVYICIGTTKLSWGRKEIGIKGNI